MSTATVTTTTTTATEAAAAAAATAQPVTTTTTTTSSSSSAGSSGSGHYYYYLPLVSWKHGMSHKASGTSITAWMDLAMTLDGRDKITKLLQYISRFLAWYYGSVVIARNAKNAAERFANLKVSLTNSRKAFRLGRTFMELQKVYVMKNLLLPTLMGQYWQQTSLSSNTNNNNNSSSSIIALIGTAIKCLGLAGFWAGDNVNYLSSSGFLDNYQITDMHQRLQQRKRLATRAGIFANRSYFCGAVAGLIVNARAYLLFRRETHERLQQIQIQMTQLKNNDSNSNNSDSHEDIIKKNASSSSSSSSELLSVQKQKILDETQEKQFVLFVALVKSCCDVLAFSNNPGVDLWEKYSRSGRKLNEGIHCVAGLLSALTVLYNNFPKNK